MIRHLLLSCVIVAFGSAAFAHHTTPGAAHQMAKVRITDRVLADGKPLTPGTYEVIITDERPALENGTPSENQRWVELVHDGQVVAREIAEVFPAAERPVGTSGTGSLAAAVQRLQGDEFVRIAVTAGGARFLVHLPMAARAGQ